MQTRTLTAQVPEPVADKLDAAAARLHRPQSWVIAQALDAWLDRDAEYHRRTLEGLADVDAGRLIDHELVQAWADSLGTNHELPIPLPD
jgi:predicted transcriptional regulator